MENVSIFVAEIRKTINKWPNIYSTILPVFHFNFAFKIPTEKMNKEEFDLNDMYGR